MPTRTVEREAARLTSLPDLAPLPPGSSAFRRPDVTVLSGRLDTNVARRSLLRRNRDAHAADPQAIAARLEQAVAGSFAPDGAPLQFIGVVHTRESYANWREQQRPDLRATTPPLNPGCWALLLWAMQPAGVRAFVQGRPRDLYTAPLVGMPPPTASYQAALAHSIASFLELTPGAYRFAPPILVTSQTPRLRMHLEPLERTWELPPSEALGVRR